MTHSAINEGFAVCQARLGAKIHDAKDPAGDLGPMFRQVVGTLFKLAGRNEDRWLRVTWLAPDPGVRLRARRRAGGDQGQPRQAGRQLRAGAAGPAGGVGPDARAGAARTRHGPRDRAPTLPSFHFSADLWIRCLYDSLVAFHRPGADRERLLAALTPLYFGRTAGFISDTLDMTTDQAERVIDDQARAVRGAQAVPRRRAGRRARGRREGA